jgi:hypothetical protein
MQAGDLDLAEIIFPADSVSLQFLRGVKVHISLSIFLPSPSLTVDLVRIINQVR